MCKIITILSTSEAMKKYTKFLWTCNYAIIYDIKIIIWKKVNKVFYNETKKVNYQKISFNS